MYIDRYLLPLLGEFLFGSRTVHRQDHRGSKRASTKIQKPVWAWPTQKDVTWRGRKTGSFGEFNEWKWVMTNEGMGDFSLKSKLI